jgi:hypothetical protein
MPSFLRLVFCAERWRVIARFTVAASEYLQALSEQLKSVTLSNGFGLETKIAAARQWRDEAKYAILQHESEHGC